MFLRTVSRKNRDGSKVSYLQIVKNHWSQEKQVSQTRIVCTLGRVDGKGSTKLRQLAASIRKRLSLEELAGLDGWQFEDSWEHGAFHAVSELWEQLSLRGILERAVKDENRSVPFERAVFAMIANRCLAPSSKLCCYDQWLAEDVYFSEGKELALHHLYRSMDLLDRPRRRSRKRFTGSWEISCTSMWIWSSTTLPACTSRSTKRTTCGSVATARTVEETTPRWWLVSV